MARAEKSKNGVLPVFVPVSGVFRSLVAAGIISAGALLASPAGAADLIVGGVTNDTYTSVTGPDGVVKINPATTTTLQGTNTYSGNTLIQSGTLALDSAATLNSAGTLSLSFAGATLDLSQTTAPQSVGSLDGNSGTFIKLGTGALSLSQSAPGTFNGTISGSGSLVKLGAGTLTLAGVNTYTGGTTIQAGMLQLQGGGSLASTGAVNLAGAGAVLDIGGSAIAQTIGALNGVAGTTLSLGGNTLTLGDGSDATFQGSISGQGALVKQGSGKLTLTGANTLQGGVTLNAGTLAFGNAGALGTGVLTVGGASTLQNQSGSLGNNVVLNADLTVSTASALTMSGDISGAGALIKQGPDTLTLTGAGSYSGGTTINAGTLAMGAGGSLSSTGAVKLAAAGSNFDITAGGNQVIGVLNGVAGSSVGLGANTLTIMGVSNGSFDGDLTGMGGLEKRGLGIQGLSGANTYAGGTTLAAGGLLLGNGLAMGTGALSVQGAATLDTTAFLTVANPIDLGADLELLGSNPMTLAGAISGGGGLIKQGGSTVTLTGANTYTGGTTINSGRLSIGAGGSLVSTGLVNLNSVLARFDISAGGNQSIGALAGVAGAGVDLGGSTLTLGGVVDTSYAGGITGTGGLVKNGFAKQTLLGSSSFNGGVTLNAGALALGNNNALGTGVLTIGGSSVIDSTTAITLANNMLLNAPLTILGSNSLTLNGQITGAGGLDKNGASTLTMGGASFYSGGTNINAGTLALAAGAHLSPVFGVTIGSGAVFDLSAGGNIDISSGNPSHVFGPVSGTGTIFVGSNQLKIGDPTNSLFSAAIAGTGSLLKVGGGTLTLTNANTYTGGTTIDTGTLELGAGASLASTGAVSLINAGTRLDISASGADQAIGQLNGVAGSSISMGANSLTVGDTGSSVFNGDIDGTGGLIKQGTGTLTLAGSNTYTGDTTIDNGLLVLVAPGAQPATSSTLHLGNAGAGFDIAGLGADLTLASLDGAAGSSVALGAHSLTLTHAAGVYAGGINGTGGLIVDGGQLTLDGVNAYTGATAVNAGATLLVGSAGATASGSNVTVNGTLGGSGTVGGNTTVSSGGTLAAGGLNAKGTLTFGGDLAIANGATLDFDLGAPGPDFGTPGQGDHVVVANNLDIGTSTLIVHDDGSMGPGLYNLFSWGGALNMASPGFVPPTGMSLQVLTADKQINLVNAQGATLSVWNGNGQASAGSLGGGSGTWSLSSNTWSDTTGSHTGPMFPQPSFAVFAGAPGTVTVDNSHGAVSATGMQFFSDGYRMTGDTLGLVGTGGTAPVVRVNTGATAVIDNAISGSDGINKTDGGTLVLNGANTYSGNTTVSGGTLSVSSDANLGQAANKLDFQGGTLRVTGTGYTTTGRDVVLGSAGGAFDIADAANSFTVGQSLGGSGNLVKLGAGMLVLAGNSAAYAGNTQVRAGALQVDGSLGGSVAVQSGAVLAGTGTVGSTTIASGATLAPGNAASPKGTLTVNGNLALASGSTYQVRTDAAGNSSSVHVTGSAAVAGTALDVGDNGSYAVSTRYGILSADGGVSGTFDTVSSNLAFLTPSLQYGANTVDLLMSMKQDPNNPGQPIHFADEATTGNQRAVANALQSLADSSNAGSANLYTRVLNLPEGAPAAVFDSLSGEVHASNISTLQGVADRVGNMALSHLRSNLNAGQLPGAPTAQLGGGDASTLPQSAAQPVWAQVFGNWRTHSGTGDTARTSESAGGLFIGGDQGIGNGWRLGGALGYTDSHTSLSGLSSTSDVDSYSAAIYGGKAFAAGAGKINLSLGAAYTWNDVKTKRQANAAGVSEELTSSYGASTGQVFGELGYAMPLNDRVTLEPFVGASYNDLRTRGFSESGGDAALDGKSEHNRVAATTLGLHAQTTFESSGALGRLHGTLGWRHAYGDVNPQATMAFQGSQTFTVSGTPIARDAAVLELGVDMAVTKRTTVGLVYGGQFGSGNKQNTGSLDVRYRF